MTAIFRPWFFVFASTLLFACVEPPPRSAFEMGAPARDKAAHLLALSTYEASVGTVIDAVVSGLDGPVPRSPAIHFAGQFKRSDGTLEPVDFEAPAREMESTTVRWTSFGPYGNPFSGDGAAIGLFEGTAGMRLYDQSGAMVEDGAPIPLHFSVKPSIVVHELQPTSASCSGSVKRAIGGAAYKLRVEAAGFDPLVFTYIVSVPGDREPIAVRHLAQGRFDTVGEHGDFVLPTVPDGVQSYEVVITVEGKDAAGQRVSTAFATAVHRPLEVFYDGNVMPAEILAPVPVSGCIPGGEAGRMVQYTESMEETRTKNVEVNWNQSWLTSHTVSIGSNQTVGTNDTNGIGFSTSDQTNWNWSLGAEVNGTLSIEKLVELGMSVNTSVGGGGSHGTESSGSQQRSVDTSETTTDTREAGTQNGGQKGGSFSWQVSSSQSISRDFGGTVIAGTYGVFYRQTLRLVRRAALVTYNQCGAATVVGNVDLSDWDWSPDLALGNSCPPLPASNLPSARCVVPPCAGD